MSLPGFTNYSNQSGVLANNYATTTSSAPNPVATYYSQNPWAGLTANERMVYDSVLRDIFDQRTIFAPFVTFEQNLGARNAPVMQITEKLPIHANVDPIGLRDQWIGSSHFDTRAIQITFSRYGGKVSYSEYDDINNIVSLAA